MTTARSTPDRFRIAGLLLAVAGICVHQLVAPSLSTFRPLVALGGALIAVSGLIVIAAGVRRRLLVAETSTVKTPCTPLPLP